MLLTLPSIFEATSVLVSFASTEFVTLAIMGMASAICCSCHALKFSALKLKAFFRRDTVPGLQIQHLRWRRHGPCQQKILRYTQQQITTSKAMTPLRLRVLSRLENASLAVLLVCKKSMTALLLCLLECTSAKQAHTHAIDTGNEVASQGVAPLFVTVVQNMLA